QTRLHLLARFRLFARFKSILVQDSTAVTVISATAKAVADWPVTGLLLLPMPNHLPDSRW
ncbi:MAG: hypothetical protein RLZZ622_944, partial [Planctomycetota bacterium]